MCALRHCFCIAYYSCTPEKARPGSLRFTIFQCILQAGTKARLLYRASRYNCPLFSLPERPLKVECFPKKGWKKLKSRREYKESITALRQLNTTFFLWPLMNLESCRKNEKTSLGSWDKTAKLWPSYRTCQTGETVACRQEVGKIQFSQKSDLNPFTILEDKKVPLKSRCLRYLCRGRNVNWLAKKEKRFFQPNKLWV